jgi:hypothetical protein
MMHRTTKEYVVIAKQDWERIQSVLFQHPDVLDKLSKLEVIISPISVEGGTLTDLFTKGGLVERDTL